MRFLIQWYAYYISANIFLRHVYSTLTLIQNIIHQKFGVERLLLYYDEPDQWAAAYRTQTVSIHITITYIYLKKTTTILANYVSEHGCI